MTYHCNKSVSNPETPPPLTSPRKWFSYADNDQTGFIGKKDMVEAVSAHLVPRNIREILYITTKISSICKLCQIDSCRKISFYLFLHFKVDKQLIQVKQGFEKKFRKKCNDTNTSIDSHGAANMPHFPFIPRTA